MRLNAVEMQRAGIRPEQLGRYKDKVDLHLHSVYSSAALDPRLIVNAAEDLGLARIAITDHSNLRGNQIARDYARAEGLAVGVLAGVEIESRAELVPLDLYVRQIGSVYPGIGAAEFNRLISDRALNEYDILGYKFDPNAPELLRFEAAVLEVKRARIAFALDRINDQLDQDGIKGERLRLEAIDRDPGIPLTRANLSQYLEEAGYGQYANKKFINPIMKEAYDECGDLRPSVKESIDLIHAAGGRAFLAHPFLGKRVRILTGLEVQPRGLSHEKYWLGVAQEYLGRMSFFAELIDVMVGRFKALGGDGVEVLHSYNLLLPGSRTLLELTASDYSLWESGGSDFHNVPGAGYHKSGDDWHIGIAALEQLSERDASMSLNTIAGWAAE